MAEPLMVAFDPVEDDALMSQPDYEQQIVRYVLACRREAEQARQVRLRQNERNLDAYHGRQDWSHKLKGQSKEFLPKVQQAVEQFVAAVKRAMTDFGDWGALDYMPGTLPAGLESPDCWRLLSAQLNSLSYTPDERLDFPTLIADALKVGVLESLMVFKVHGQLRTQPRFLVERGVQMLATPMGSIPQIQPSLARRPLTAWHLAIDLVQPQDYYPDPTGRKLYEIHRVERDLHDVIALAEGDDPLYDPEVVMRLVGTTQEREEEDRRREEDRGQQETTAPSFRKQIVIDEFWGTILDEDGTVLSTNVVCSVANDRYLIRPPEENPAWHQQSPFVACPLRRLPFSVWHQALMDDAVALNLALNELHNLILDGGIAATWGVNQLRTDWLEDPKQVQEGIAQGTTLRIKAEVPPGMKVFEQVAFGHVAPETMGAFQLLDREFQMASLTNDLKLGQLPARQVKATEIVEAQQGQAGLIDGIVRDVEDRCIEPLLRKAWLLCVQHLSQMPSDEVVATLGMPAALTLARLSQPERYATLAQGFQLRVYGLSAQMARARDFQKLLALQEAIKGNPLLLQAFMQRFSADKFLSRLFKTLSIDPESLLADEAEQQQMASMPPMMGGGMGDGPAPSPAPQAGGMGGMAGNV